MVITMDPTNSVNDQESNYSHYQFTLVTGVLKATINLNKYSNSCYGASDKMEIMINLRAEQMKLNMVPILEKLVDQFGTMISSLFLHFPVFFFSIFVCFFFVFALHLC
jgi:hypothetical protein